MIPAFVASRGVRIGLVLPILTLWGFVSRLKDFSVLLGSTVSEVQQVAALPWRRDKNGGISVLLITSRINRKWMLPKGWPLPQKSEAESAMVEATEEAGVVGVVAEAPIGSYHYLRLERDGSTRPSQAMVYSLEVERELPDWKEKGQRSRRWVKASKAAKLVYERDLRRFLTDFAKGTIVLPD